MPDIQIQITASLVAWYGAIVATVMAIIQAILIFRDRKQIKVRVNKNIRIIGELGSYPYKEGVDYVAVRIINTGRREVTVDTAGARLLNGRSLQAFDILKRGQVILSEGKRYDVFIEQDKLNFSEIAYFFAEDATGTVYKKNIANPARRALWFLKRLLK